MRVSICCNAFPKQSGIQFAGEQINKLTCHEVFAHSDCVLTDDCEKSTVLESEGIKVAFIVVEDDQSSSVPGEHTEDRSAYIYRAVREIRLAKAQNDFVIVNYPCGGITGIYPPARIRQVCRTMVKSGADVVLCRINGGISSFELCRGANILYGCGEQESGMIVHLDISDKIELQFIPVKITETQIEPLEGKERQKSLEQLVINSEKLKRSSEQNN